MPPHARGDLAADQAELPPTEAGQPPHDGEEEVSDQNYLIHRAIHASSEVMRYEKAMPEDWFRVRFADGRISNQYNERWLLHPQLIAGC